MAEFILNSGKTHKLVVSKKSAIASPIEDSEVTAKPSATSKTNEKGTSKSEIESKTN